MPLTVSHADQIIVWEQTKRLEAGLKRELYSCDSWPDIRACRFAKHVLEKRSVMSRAVLVLDAAKLKTWIVEANEPSVLRVRRACWQAVIATVPCNTVPCNTISSYTVASGSMPTETLQAPLAHGPSFGQPNQAAPRWHYTSTGITAVFATPVHDRHLANACLRALRWSTLIQP